MLRSITHVSGRPGAADAGVLITIPLSHFCEKARWALDHAGLAYSEHGYPPGVHKLVVRRHGAESAPLLLLGDRMLSQSTEILRFADRACPPGRALYPAADDARRATDELIARLDLILGPQARLWFYSWSVKDPQRLFERSAIGLTPLQRQLLSVHFPRLVSAIAAHMRITERSAAQARDRIDEELRIVSATLADGRHFLNGESFGAADLTFAALAGPLLQPPGYGGEHVTLPPVPAQLAPQVRTWRSTPAGALALRLYREHRARP